MTLPSLQRFCATFSLVGALVVPAVAHATTISVSNFNDSGPGSLRAAIETANAQSGDDVIDLTGLSGQIALQSALPVISSNIALNGPGADKLTLMRGPEVPARFRFFFIGNGPKNGPTVSISGLRFVGGNPDDNDSQGKGGAIYAYNSTLDVERCGFSGNQANSGGAVQVEGGEVRISASTLDGNSAKFFGGALFHANSELTLVTSTFSRNQSGATGGAIYSTGAGATSLRMLACTVSSNTATGGAGLYLRSNSTLIVNSTITSNTASAAGAGGGISYELVDKGKHEIGSSIIAGNPQGDQIYAKSGPGAFVSLGCNIVGTVVGPVKFDGAGDQMGVADPKLGPLKNNGGPTHTHLPTMDSPAIDKGREYVLLSQTDQRGYTRTFDFPKTADAPPQSPKEIFVENKSGTDVGAVEVQPTLTIPKGLPVFKLPPNFRLPGTPVPPILRPQRNPKP